MAPDARQDPARIQDPFEFQDPACPQDPAGIQDPVVSVIVPCYNVEHTLDQALSSIEGQSLAELQIICVDDGSTDGTADVLARHAARDARIQVVSKPNGGYGQACNRGLDAVHGTWTAIVEPDDWVLADMFRDMVEFAAHMDGDSSADGARGSVPVDVVKTPYWRIVNPDTPDERHLNCSYKGRVRPARQPFALGDAGTVHLVEHHPSIWSAIYRTDFLREHGIRFREIPGAGWADNPFLLETLCQARGIAYLDRAYYCYREETAEHFAAAMARAPFLPLERWEDMADVLDRLEVQDPGIRASLARRGFTYLGYTATACDIHAPQAHALMAHMFARMDDALVLADPRIPASWKEEYAQVKGLARRHFSNVAHYASLAAEAAYSLVNTGPAATLAAVRGHLVHPEQETARAAATPAASLRGAAPAQEAEAPSGSPLFSLVIPVYNAAAHLEECLDSVLAQTYGGFEAVCVDDGSTDASAAMLARYMAQDARIRVLAKPNGGPSSARNAGLQAAAGRFVVFLDADDALEPGALARLAQVVEPGGMDVAVFSWTCFPGKADHWTESRTLVRNAFYPAFDPALLFQESTQPFLRACIRRRLLVERGIRFDEELHLGEDAQFLFQVYPAACGVRLLPDALYRYRLPHAGSLMQAAREDAADECLQGVAAVVSVFDAWQRQELLPRYGAQLVAWSVSYSLYTVLRQPEPLRGQLADLLRSLWLAHWTEDELRDLPLPAHARTLVERALSGDVDGCAKDLLAYRLAEYGPADLALTAADRLLGR